MEETGKVLLMILDGWGIGKQDDCNGVYIANTPFMDRVSEGSNVSTLKTFGENVGLPEGQMGNSEVGHLNIGAGRIVYQMLLRINNSIKNGELDQIPALNVLAESIKGTGKKIHLTGLVSDGGVHASTEHLIGICDYLRRCGLDGQTFIHVFTDGRDTDPHSGIAYVKNLVDDERLGKARIASVVGRYFAMDRDKRWERVAKAYHLMVNGKGKSFNDPIAAIQDSYDQGITDEFIEPCLITNDNNEPLALIEEDDAVLCFNFRTDRGREITMALTQSSYPEQNMYPLKIDYYTMTEYDKSFRNIKILFENKDIRMTLGEYLSTLNIGQVRAAETEKYPHVTFFFSGGREEPFKREKRILIPSPKVATYDLQPEMSALPLRDAIDAELRAGDAGFVCVNFANPDMVGHTGNFKAIVKACEVVDQCAEQLTKTAQENGFKVVIIADHGNADCAVNVDGSPNTAHTTNLVPCIVLGEEGRSVKDGVLADIAPTILEMMGLKKPEEMTGSSLLK